MAKDRTTTAIRFPEDMREQLRKAAEERNLTVNYLVLHAVEELLENLIPADEFRLTRPRNDRASNAA